MGGRGVIWNRETWNSLAEGGINLLCYRELFCYFWKGIQMMSFAIICRVNYQWGSGLSKQHLQICRPSYRELFCYFWKGIQMMSFAIICRVNYQWGSGLSKQHLQICRPSHAQEIAYSLNQWCHKISAGQMPRKQKQLQKRLRRRI